MNKIQIVKTTLHIAADLGSGFIVSAIVKSNVPTNSITKLPVFVGSFALGSVAGTVAAKEIDRLVDQAVEIVNKNKNEIKLNTETTEAE